MNLLQSDIRGNIKLTWPHCEICRRSYELKQQPAVGSETLKPQQLACCDGTHCNSKQDEPQLVHNTLRTQRGKSNLSGHGQPCDVKYVSKKRLRATFVFHFILSLISTFFFFFSLQAWWKTGSSRQSNDGKIGKWMVNSRHKIIIFYRVAGEFENESVSRCLKS